MSDQIQLSVPCNLHYRDAVGALIEHICRNLKGKKENTEMVFQIISAFNEAFNNTVLHAQANKKPLEIWIEVTQSELVIEIKDEGSDINFNIDEVESPDLEALPESGLGIYIIQSFMDQVEYFPRGKDKKNRLRMVYKFHSDK